MLARVTNCVQRALASGGYAGAIWLEGTPWVEETMYWLSLLIDTTLTGDELKEPITVDDQHKHFGGGQTEATITLAPGPHTLQLVLGDWTHIPHQPPVMSKVIHITVK